MLKFFYTKNLNTVQTPIEMKENLLHQVFFVKILISFVKLLNTSLHEYSLFSVMYNKSFYWQ